MNNTDVRSGLVVTVILATAAYIACRPSGTHNNRVTYLEGATRRMQATRESLARAYARFGQKIDYLKVQAGEALSQVSERAGRILANISIRSCCCMNIETVDNPELTLEYMESILGEREIRRRRDEELLPLLENEARPVAAPVATTARIIPGTITGSTPLTPEARPIGVTTPASALDQHAPLASAIPVAADELLRLLEYRESIFAEREIRRRNSYYGIKSALAATAIVAAAAYIITHPDETQATLENTQNFAQNIWDQAPSVESFQNYVADTWETAPSYEGVTTFVQDSVESLQGYVADTWEITPSYNQISTFFKGSSQAVWNLVIPSLETNEECLAVNYGNHSNFFS